MMTNNIETWPAGSTWAYLAVFKEDGAGGGTVNIDISPGAGNEMILMFMHLGPDDYAANRTITVRIEDSANNRLMDIYSAAIDNAHVNLPLVNSDSTSMAWNKTGFPLIISGTDTLTINGASLAQNEEITVAIRARLRGPIPSITATSSGTIGTTVTTYSKVM